MAPDLRIANPVFSYLHQTTKMNIKEYQQLALRTEARNPEHTQADRWNHGVLGFITEFDEFHNAETHVDMVEEFGDVMWCVTLLADVANVDLSIIEQPLVLPESVIAWAAKAADIGKRWKYYNIPPSESALTEAVCQLYVYAREYWIKTVAKDGNISVAFDRNIAKLKVRYPEKFTTEAAANRDLAAERMALEGGDVAPVQPTRATGGGGGSRSGVSDANATGRGVTDPERVFESAPIAAPVEIVRAARINA